MEENLTFKRIAREIGGSITIAIPPEILEYLQIKTGDEIRMAVDMNKHGQRYGAFWPQEEKEEDDENEDTTRDGTGISQQ